MNKLDIFNKVKEHLLTQNEKSYQGDYCMYRAENGLKCAVGCLIKDEYYNETLEGKPLLVDTVSEAVAKSLGLGKVLPLNMFNMLSRLQDIHDNYDNNEWLVQINKLERTLYEN